MASPVLTISSFLPLTSPPRLPSKKPSWIGRPPAVRLSTMKQQVRLSYRSRGLRPPVYAVTSLSDPQWEPVEMHSKDIGDSELEFWRVFDAEVGDHQYKFRLGPGDWWVLDESKPSGEPNVIESSLPTTNQASSGRRLRQQEQCHNSQTRPSANVPPGPPSSGARLTRYSSKDCRPHPRDTTGHQSAGSDKARPFAYSSEPYRPHDTPDDARDPRRRQVPTYTTH